MKAARYYGIRELRCDELPIPTIKEDELLIKVAYAGICGSDLHIYNKQMFIQNIPETMGHEFVGRIEAVGSQVNGFSKGDAVIANPMVSCGSCPACQKEHFNCCENLGFIGEVRPGCFAEYIALPQKALIPIPKDPSSEDALKNFALAEPLAVALNVLERLSPKADEKLAIVGAGPIGLLCILLAKELYQVKDISCIGRSAYRLELAASLGAKSNRAFPDKTSFDAIIEAAGNQACLEGAVAHSAVCGRIALVSVYEAEQLSLDFNLLVGSQISLIGCNCYDRHHLEDAVSLISHASIDVAPLISAEYDLSDCDKAFRFINQKEKAAAKVLFKM